MSIEFFFRIVGAVALGVGGGYLGIVFSGAAQQDARLWASVLGAVGALTGVVITPYITTRPARYLRRLISQMPSQALVAAMIGLIAGLIVAALLSPPLALLPSPLGQILPFAGVLVFGWLGILVFVMRQHDLFTVFRERVPVSPVSDLPATSSASTNNTILLDTSVIIDGRIADVCQTGFISGTLLVPRFILNELQHIADSSETLRRNRGRRGLDVLNRLKESPVVPVRVTDMNVEGVREADDKLIILAKQLRCAILTTDFNLNKVAGIQGVTVLNINDLANAVKSVLIPGEGLLVKVIQEGKEPGQGVGYLDDGTMVVIEDGRRLINQQVDVTVTKVLQTAAGRMIFARPDRPA
ncbi:MAG TPA: PIN domain-containing protein [Anaerolineales bacterium]|nr:PIN domain-containing protein [Anaerolineales bacterium]